MKKVRHQVMHQMQVTQNAIWKHYELRNDFQTFFIYLLRQLPLKLFSKLSKIIFQNRKKGSEDTSTKGKNANYKA